MLKAGTSYRTVCDGKCAPRVLKTRRVPNVRDLAPIRLVGLLEYLPKTSVFLGDAPQPHFGQSLLPVL